MGFCIRAYYFGYFVLDCKGFWCSTTYCSCIFQWRERQMELGLCHRLISVAAGTVILPPDPAVAHITRVVRSRVSTGQAAVLQASWRQQGLWGNQCQNAWKRAKLACWLVGKRTVCWTPHEKKKRETWSINSRQPVDYAGLSESPLLLTGVFTLWL